MSRNLNKYTYNYFIKNGNIIEKYYDNNVKITICDNFIKKNKYKSKNILIDKVTKNVNIN